MENIHRGISVPMQKMGRSRGTTNWCKDSGLNSIMGIEDVADNGCTERYFELLKDAKVKGYLFSQQNYVDEALKR